MVKPAFSSFFEIFLDKQKDNYIVLYCKMVYQMKLKITHFNTHRKCEKH